MEIQAFETKDEMGRAAAEKAAEILREALATKDKARFIIATGASQFEFIKHLCETPGIDWSRTEMFHLDEYVGMAETHPASFRKYLQERFVDKAHPGTVHFIVGDAPNAAAECRRVGELISESPVDAAFVGIGENGHLAFNDPPADFETEEPYLVLNLDTECRAQQVGEGWFDTVDDVPAQAISMAIRQIMKSRNIICTVPDKRKAKAIRNCLGSDVEINPMNPSSILKKHDSTFVFLDKESASLLDQ
ncbi:glucosamine-6-phosphate deaminase [Candidatus Hydrogenedentota bacterium]